MTELTPTPAGVTPREITEVNRAEVEQLRVTAVQETFVDGVVLSGAEAAATPTSNPWYRAIYGDESRWAS